MSNRVSELESKVSELQAAVDGLTEELVETRARLTTLEEEVEPDADVPPEAAEPAPDPVPDGEADQATPAGGDAEKASPEEDTGEASEDGDSLDDSDIIVA